MKFKNAGLSLFLAVLTNAANANASTSQVASCRSADGDSLIVNLLMQTEGRQRYEISVVDGRGLLIVDHVIRVTPTHLGTYFKGSRFSFQYNFSGEHSFGDRGNDIPIHCTRP